jgi:hypothetical protein
MTIDGSIVTNLRAAVRSSERLRNERVYPQTLQFLRDLLSYAEGGLQCDRIAHEVAQLAGELGANIDGRDPTGIPSAIARH